jgi:hypothetical protein
VEPWRQLNELILDEPVAPVDVEHARLVFRRAHADVERRILSIFRVEENQADAEDATQRVQSSDVVLGREGRSDLCWTCALRADCLNSANSFGIRRMEPSRR